MNWLNSTKFQRTILILLISLSLMYATWFYLDLFLEIPFFTNKITDNILLPAQPVILFSFWFYVGVLLHNNILPRNSKIKTFFNTINIFQLFIILYSIILPVKLIIALVSESLTTEFIENINVISTNILNMVDSNTNSDTNSTGLAQNTINTITSAAADGAIMTAAVSGAYKLAQTTPSVAGKTAVIAGSLVAGGIAIGVKNLSGAYSSNAGTGLALKKISPENEPLNELLTSLLNLTGDFAIDFLIYIQCFQKLQAFFILIICYHLLFFFIDENRLENYFLKIFPSFSKIIGYFIKSVKVLKKSIILILIVSFLVLLFCNYYSIYYLQFYMDNLDGIIELYLKKE